MIDVEEPSPLWVLEPWAGGLGCIRMQADQGMEAKQ